ncbi:hypothetical protein RSAG8_12021, partial [Rhizoctonia solani AG-8 WAC10335]
MTSLDAAAFQPNVPLELPPDEITMMQPAKTSHDQTSATEYVRRNDNVQSRVRPNKHGPLVAFPTTSVTTASPRQHPIPPANARINDHVLAQIVQGVAPRLWVPFFDR